MSTATLGSALVVTETTCAAAGHLLGQWERHPTEAGVECRWCETCGDDFQERTELDTP